MTRARQSLALLFVTALVVIAVPAFAQPETYAATHPFALATATTTRLFGMGGFVTCIPDAGFANPAFAGTLTDSTAVLRQSVTDFQSGLKITGEQASVAIPLKENKRGVQVTGFRLTTDRVLFTPGTPPTTLRMSEYDLALHYGQRLGERFVVGVGVSPVFHNTVNVRVPGGGPVVGNLDSESDQGFRLGALYQLGEDDWIGAIYDRYDEDVTAAGPMLGGGPFVLGFTSEEIAIGISHRLKPNLLVAAEWQQLTTEGGSARLGDSGFRGGLEALLDNNVSFRLGSNDGTFALGVGLRGDRWNVNYAYGNDWNEDMVGRQFGSSNTHQFEANYRF